MNSDVIRKFKICVGILFLQFGNAGFGIIAKAALNKGVSHYTLSVYRNLIAAIAFFPFAFFLERKIRPKMTLGVFIKIMVLAVLDPVFGQNLMYTGMTHTTVTIAAALANLLPTFAFVLAWILRLEKVKIKEIRGQAKIVGTLIALGGATIMTLINGPIIGLPWTHEQNESSNSNGQQQPIKGAIMIIAATLGFALFFILQTITLKTYPAGMSLTTMICAMGALQGTALTFIVERDNTSIWALGFDNKLLAYVYGGIVASGLTYYVSGYIMKMKGPVFMTAFNPVALVIVAVMSSFIFAEQMSVGKVTGGAVIVIGVYMVIWGTSSDHKVTASVHQEPTSESNNPDSQNHGSNNQVSIDVHTESSGLSNSNAHSTCV